MCDCNSNIFNIQNEQYYSVSNIGNGEFIYSGSSTTDNNTVFLFKSIQEGTNITISSDSNSLTINAVNTDTFPTFSNLGSGADVYKQTLGTDVELRSITGSSAVTITELADEINISVPIDSITNLPGGLGILSNNLPTATLKSLVAGTNVNLVSDGNTITISSVDTGVTTLNNLGLGSQIGESIIGSTLNLRSLLAINGIKLLQNANDVTITSEQTISSIGVGNSLVATGLPTSTIKSLTAGTNITLTPSADTITISSTDTGVTSISNNGGGAALLQNITGSTLNSRTVTGSGDITVTQNADTVDISSPLNSITNLPGGTSIVANNLPSATVKSLVPGSNISIVNDANTITINNTATVVDSVSNLGGGAEPLIDVLGNTIRARTLVGVAGTTVNQSGSNINITSNTTNNVGTGAGIFAGVTGNNNNLRTIIGTNGVTISTTANEMTIADNQIQSQNNVVPYNYMQAKNGINLANSYISPSGLTSNVVTIPSYYEGTATTPTATTLNYIPAPRYGGPAFIPFTTTAGNGTKNASFVKLYPNITVANDYFDDYILAAATGTGQLYQINVQLQTEKPMLNYDGTTVTLVNVDAIAQDIADNLLFYVLTTSNTTIRWYDWTDKTTGVLVNIATVSGWTVGSTIVSMTYDNLRNNLYVQGNANNSRIAIIPIRAYDRNLVAGLIPFGTISTFSQPYTQPLGGSNHSIAIDEQTLTPYFVIIPTAGTGTVIQTNLLASGSTVTLASVIPEVGATSLDLVWGNSGRLYVHSDATNRLYRINYGNSLGNGFTLLFTTVRAYTNFTRCPYGIVA